MSEQPHFVPEHTPEMSPLRRYYSDLRCIETHVSALMSLAELFEHTPVVPVLSLNEVASSDLMPDDDDFWMDERLSRERMALLPLYVVAPSLEQSELPSSDVKDWYEEVANRIKWLTKDQHSEDCLKCYTETIDSDRDPFDAKCDKSDVCPWRYMEAYFGKPVLNKEVIEPYYGKAMSRHYELTMARLAIGQGVGLLSPTYTRQTAQIYRGTFAKAK